MGTYLPNMNIWKVAQFHLSVKTLLQKYSLTYRLQEIQKFKLESKLSQTYEFYKELFSIEMISRSHIADWTFAHQTLMVGMTG